MRFDKSQAKAVRHGTGPALVLAGPGSGKTSVICGRTLKLIETDGIPPERILVITFSRKAAEEMERRFLRQASGTRCPYFGTFHSFFFRILKEVYEIGNDSLLTDGEKVRILKEAFRKRFPEKGKEATEELLRTLLREFSFIKSGAGYIENFESSVVLPLEFRTLFHAYQKRLRELGKIDFDDMILLCLKLLRERKDICRAWQKKYSYILVDEFQDISPMQYEIVNLLAQPENNLFAVGDDDQSIYAFRGAKPDLMNRFLKDHRKAKVITLRVNYRCAPAILEASQKVIRRNRYRFEKKQVSSKEKRMRGEVRVLSAADPASQYAEMGSEIRGLLSRGEAPESIAVLIRNTLNLQLMLDILEKNGVPAVRNESAADQKRRRSGCIPVMTMHAAKGLEFDHVFLPDLNEGILPGNRARKRAQIEEERRIFYVAMTRAAKTLTIFFCETRRRKQSAPSRFLSDLL